MGQPAARLTDMHACPMVTGPVPHVGGPIIGPGVPTVLIGGMPAAVIGDMATCTGPPDTLIKGSAGVLIGGKPAARMGDNCAHGGTIIAGCPTVLIGESMPGAPPVVAPLLVAVNVPSAQGSPSSTVPQSGTSTAQSTPSAVPKGGAQKATEEKKTWVAFKLVDESGKAIISEKYRLQLPDGSIREGMTNLKGEVRVDGIDSGTCKISFPELDGDEWKTV